ncbi:MAG TPA: class I SAM-dependent methyltransferase [Solirubrobacteraceae bacterium]|jgi:SAM-dependent methyltransferase|nr:class I SAM-dependent methyltransferase [Solirubrobacteraceae bacterium]
MPTEHEIHPAAATGFARAADAYERGRPGYPDAAIDAFARHLGPQVIDLAAGTGKLTRMLAARGYDVLAVEPIAEMRALIAPDARVHVVDGTAEQIPAGDATAHAVCVAQAFHWFHHDRALPEIHRVLRPGGVLVVLWNRRRMDDEIHQRIQALLAPHRGDAPAQASEEWRRAPLYSGLFEAAVQRRFDNEQRLDGDGLADRFGSVSFVAALEPAPRDELLAALRGLADAGPVTLRYRTETEVWRRRG